MASCVARARRSGNPHPDALAGIRLDRDPLHPFQRTEPALGLLGLRRLGAKPLDETLHLGDSPVLLLLGGEQRSAALRPLRQVAVVAPLVARKASEVPTNLTNLNSI